ncbi:hypothetical protein HY642_04845 [Candidatus Woesearchaeota archaeon]|nr:hypothetical protein [Candidatus Woesearchaeota archaeon]
MQRYKAEYHIDHGVSQGFGIKYPDESTERYEFAAESTIDAILEMEARAAHYAREFLSNPETGRTTVTLKRLEAADGTSIDVLAEIAKAVPRDSRLEDYKKLHFPNGQYTTCQTWIDHVLAVERAEK